MAPAPAVEAQLLSEGFVTAGPAGNRGAGSVVGTPDDGRFIRQGDQVSLQEAIQTEPIIQTNQLETRIFVGTCSASRINARTGFYWNTRRRGIQGPTQPFNRAYVQAVESGGVVWTVIPRPGTVALEPEPGVIATAMAKTMRPYRMFAAARARAQAQMRSRVRRVMQAEVRKVGRT